MARHRFAPDKHLIQMQQDKKQLGLLYSYSRLTFLKRHVPPIRTNLSQKP